MKEEKQSLDAFVELGGDILVEEVVPVPGLAGEMDPLGLHTLSVHFPGDVQWVVVVEDLASAFLIAVKQGYSLAVEPWKNRRGTGMILQDDHGIRICLMERREAEGGSLPDCVSRG